MRIATACFNTAPGAGCGAEFWARTKNTSQERYYRWERMRCSLWPNLAKSSSRSSPFWLHHKIDKKKHRWRAAGREGGGIRRQADYSVHTHIPWTELLWQWTTRSWSRLWRCGTSSTERQRRRSRQQCRSMWWWSRSCLLPEMWCMVASSWWWPFPWKKKLQYGRQCSTHPGRSQRKESNQPKSFD